MVDFFDGIWKCYCKNIEPNMCYVVLKIRCGHTVKDCTNLLMIMVKIFNKVSFQFTVYILFVVLKELYVFNCIISCCVF